MTTNKPEVKAWIISAYVPYSGFHRHVCMSEDDARVSRATFERIRGEVEEELLISLSDYEALQAECEKLRRGLNAVQGGLPDKGYLNVSCENVGYKPISLREVRERLGDV